MKSNIKVFEKRGKNPGMNVVIMAGVHGNEICGINAFNELIPKINIENGKVTFIYADLEAARQNKRFVEYDLNRCFFDEQPKNIVNTLEGRTAREIISYLMSADAMLDLHSSSSSDDLRYIVCEKDCLDIISSFEPENVLLGTDPVCPGGSDGYMHNLGKPGICMECGPHKSKKSLRVAKESILNFLTKTGNISANGESINVSKKIFRADYLYRNKKGPFRLAKEFKDFDKFSERTLIGFDGDEKIYAEKGDVIMFHEELQDIGGECFLIFREETLSKPDQLDKLGEDK